MKSPTYEKGENRSYKEIKVNKILTEKKTILAYDQFSPSTSSRQLTSFNALLCYVKRKLARTGTWRELVACQYICVYV